ncbi:MAG: histidine kinase [Frankiales bacterium]|nr:histidine kinase [Frankiales bacterium]
MLVRDVMTATVVSVGPTHTVRQVAQAMAARKVGAAVVHDPDADGPGILTERDVLEAVAQGEDPDTEPASAHLTREAVVASPDWDLLRAAETMLSGGFRHLVVCDGSDVVGVLSVRDVLRAWTERGGPAAT